MPPRALAISVAALVIPVVTVYSFPDWTSSGGGMVLSWKWSPEESNLIGP